MRRCALCENIGHTTRECPEWAKMSPQEIWDLAKAIPRVASAWKSWITDTMRVDEIWVRYGLKPMPQTGHDYNIGGGVASICGPYEGGMWIWKANYACTHAASKEAAFEAADRELRSAGYLLCEAEDEDKGDMR